MDFYIDMPASEIARAYWARRDDVPVDGGSVRIFSSPGYVHQRIEKEHLSSSDAVIIGQLSFDADKRYVPSPRPILDIINLYGLIDLSNVERVMLMSVREKSAVRDILNGFDGRVICDWTETFDPEMKWEGFRFCQDHMYRKEEVSFDQASHAITVMLSSAAFNIAFELAALRTGGLSSLPDALSPDTFSKIVFSASAGLLDMPSSAFLPLARIFPIDKESIAEILSAYPELSDMASKVFTLDALCQLLDYVEEQGDLQELYIPREALGNRENSIERMEKAINNSRLSLLLETYLDGVPLEDIIA